MNASDSVDDALDLYYPDLNDDDYDLDEEYQSEEKTKTRVDVAKALKKVNHYGFIANKDADDENPQIDVSRAFAVWFLLNNYSSEYGTNNILTNFDETEAKESIVDASDDGGIDSIIIHRDGQSLDYDIIILQSKYIKGYVKKTDIIKMEHVVEKIIDSRPFDNPNTKLEAKLDEINQLINDETYANIRLQFVLTTTGRIGPKNRKRLDDLDQSVYTYLLGQHRGSKKENIRGISVKYYDHERIGIQLLGYTKDEYNR